MKMSYYIHFHMSNINYGVTFCVLCARVSFYILKIRVLFIAFDFCCDFRIVMRAYIYLKIIFRFVEFDFCGAICTFVFIFLDGSKTSVLLCYCLVCFTFLKQHFHIFVRPLLHCSLHSNSGSSYRLQILHLALMHYPTFSCPAFSGPAFSAPNSVRR